MAFVAFVVFGLVLVVCGRPLPLPLWPLWRLWPLWSRPRPRPQALQPLHLQPFDFDFRRLFFSTALICRLLVCVHLILLVHLQPTPTHYTRQWRQQEQRTGQASPCFAGSTSSPTNRPPMRLTWSSKHTLEQRRRQNRQRIRTTKATEPRRRRQ